jgi:hypothetical protein
MYAQHRQWVTAPPPAPVRGIGSALRSSYAPSPSELPTDMLRLLERLN